MENNTLGLLATVASAAGRRGGDPGGRGDYSGGGSISTVSKEDNLILSSEESSSYPDESELELGLGLSLLSGGALKSKLAPRPSGQYAKILTAKDFPSLVSSNSLSSSSSSSSVTTKANASSAGTKRAADSVSPPRKGLSPVVGWPPIKAYRMNSLANQARSLPTEEFDSTVDKGKSKIGVVDESNNGSDKNENDAKERGPPKTSWFVKVNMDGIPIGRKVDLSAHSCYKTLTQMLEDMFCTPTASLSEKRSNMKRHDAGTEAIGTSDLLDRSAGFVLTYEDKEGDWMLVGDVPWGMFLSSVRRLRIIRTSEANGLAPSPQERNGRQIAKPV